MTTKKTILKLQTLKEIKPNTEWAFLVKAQLLAEEKPQPVMVQEQSLFNYVKSFFVQKKLAYVFATFMALFLGAFTLLNRQMPVNNASPVVISDIAKKSAAALLMQNDLKANIENFKKSSSVKTVQAAAKSLADAITKDPQLAKGIALELKDDRTLSMLDAGPDVKESSDVLYKKLDDQLFIDFKKTTFTEEQQKIVDEAMDLYAKGDYSGALQKTFLINSESK